MSQQGSTEESRAVATAYFEAWRGRDWESLRSTLADDVEFEGVLATTHGADETLAGLQGMAQSILQELRLHARVADGQDVITWFDLVTQSGAVLPTANWSHVENGKITRIRVTFDPTPLNP